MIVALRQEIFICNMMSRPVGPIADYWSFDFSVEPASDVIWAYRIIAHAARATNFAYGEEPKTVQRWDELWKSLCEWEKCKPVSLNPIYTYHSIDGESGPDNRDEAYNEAVPKHPLYTIHYTYDCPIAAQQYYQLCRILLLAHDPRMPSLGIGRAEFRHRCDEGIRNAVRNICSIAISNPEYKPSTLTAGTAIAMCGELFSDPDETRQFWQILVEAEQHLGWPHLKVSRKLRAFWGLDHDGVDL
jgi:hypothetical protein